MRIIAPTAPAAGYELGGLRARTIAGIEARMGDRLYDLADAVAAIVDANPAGDWTPSKMARLVKCDTRDARDVMEWMVASIDRLDSDARGAWTHYFPLTTDARTAKLYR